MVIRPCKESFEQQLYLVCRLLQAAHIDHRKVQAAIAALTLSPLESALTCNVCARITIAAF